MGDTIKNVDIEQPTQQEFLNKISAETNYQTDREIIPIEYFKCPSDVGSSLSIMKSNDMRRQEKSKHYYNIISNGLNSVITSDWTEEIGKKITDEGINISDYCDTPSDIELLFIYLKNVDDCSMYKNATIQEKIEIASKIKAEDKDRLIAHSTPILMNGKVNTKIDYPNATTTVEKYEYEGEYLKFYNEYGVEVIAPLSEITANEGGDIYSENAFTGEYKEEYIKQISKYYSDIMLQSNRYSDKFRQQTMNNLKTICLANITNKPNFKRVGGAGHEWIAYVAENEPEFLHYSSDMVIDTNGIIDGKPGHYDFMIDAYTHELGHVFADASDPEILDFFGEDIDREKAWKDIYNQIVQYCDDKVGPLRNYASENSAEAFAECVTEYYGGISGIYNPNDLKVIEIDYNGNKVSLYDVMAFILDGDKSLLTGN